MFDNAHIFLFFALSTQAACATNSLCSDALAQLNTKQEQAILRANKHNRYTVIIVSKQINGIEKWVFLVGEYHEKEDAREAKIGIRLVDAFSFRGLEDHTTVSYPDFLNWFTEKIKGYPPYSTIDLAKRRKVPGMLNVALERENTKERMGSTFRSLGITQIAFTGNIAYITRSVRYKPLNNGF